MTFHHDEIDFDAFFNPKRLAMIGATPNPDKWGYMILSNIINGGFKGEIYPVNPKHDKILDIKCYPSIAEIPSTIDLAVISTPVNSVMTVVDECIKKSIPAAIVITSGFSETGQEGLKSERILVQKARDGGMRLMGPNTMGLFSAKSSLTALMPATKPSSGNVSMVSQSGNVGTQLMGWGVQVGIGFSRFVSSGNEGDITCMDYVQNFASDEDTKVIFVYMESLKKARLDPGKIREVVKKKPILVFKGGKTKMGLLAAASHTGAIAGSLDIYEGYFRQSGMIEIKSTL
ncbi:MAG: CoA-binding protein, partial [Thermodesulfobacteriota bacterium]|nr:CoA-binding protein [Thermodesulfobacteriota bacterium]